MFVHKIESGCNGCKATTRLSKQEPGRPVETAAVLAASINALLADWRNVAGGNLPLAIPLNKCVRELHDAIESTFPKESTMDESRSIP